MVEFLQSCDPDLATKIMVVRNVIAYLSDVFAKFNELNLSLQGKKVNLVKGAFAYVIQGPGISPTSCNFSM